MRVVSVPALEERVAAAMSTKHLYAVQSQKPREGLLRLSIVCILFIIFG